MNMTTGVDAGTLALLQGNKGGIFGGDDGLLGGLLLGQLFRQSIKRRKANT